MASAAISDLRSEFRSLCSGEVQIQLDGVQSVIIGQMMDISTNGFRASHNCPDLQPGKAVRFHHKFFTGWARVAWTNSHVGQSQSGFQIIRN